MDSFHIRLEKPQSSNHTRIPRLMTLFRFLELLVLLIIVSRFFTTFSLSFIFSAQHFTRGLSVNLTSPRYVFLLGNAIVITLFLISRSLPSKREDKNDKFYQDYTDKCRKDKGLCGGTEKKATDLISEVKIRTCKSYSENMDKRGRENYPVLRRSMTERCRGIKAEFGSERCSDDMSGEEFRQTVEAFIARQQRILRRK